MKNHIGDGEFLVSFTLNNCFFVNGESRGGCWVVACAVGSHPNCAIDLVDPLRGLLSISSDLDGAGQG